LAAADAGGTWPCRTPQVSLRPSVAALFERPGQIFLAKRKAGGAMGGRWELPGGKAEAGETLLQALEREIQEEFGLSCRGGLELGQTNFSHNGLTQVVHLFQAFVDGGNDLLDNAHLVEHDQTGWFTFTQIGQMQNQLVDSDWQLLKALIK
jgi:mutator protein MutT